MLQALLYKEWIKLRWFLLGLALLSVLACGNLALQFRRLFEFRPAMINWMATIHDHRVLYQSIQYNTIIAGVVIAAVQFIPEVTRRRLRLLFHLPIPQARAVYTIVATGLLCTAVLGLVNLAGLVAVVARWFPHEAVASAAMTSAPWWIAGLLAYLAAAVVLLEPAWWRRILYAATCWFLVSLLLEGRSHDLYTPVLWRYLVLGALLLVALHLPAYRVKRGIR